jgi:hypothetical protein
MLQLAEVQRRLLSAVLHGATPDLHFKGRILPREAMSIHRDTVIGCLVNALRLSYPTVDALVADRFFDQAGQQFALSRPPRRPDLEEFEEQFIGFLRELPAAAGLPYLTDVARLDRTIGRVVRQPAGQRQFPLDARVSLLLPQSLSVLRLTYPAHAIRAAIGDASALAALDMAASDYRVVVWRKDDVAAVQCIRTEAGNFLGALIAGADIDTASQSSSANAPVIAGIIQQDVFSASFCRVQTHSEETS